VVMVMFKPEGLAGAIADLSKKKSALDSGSSTPAMKENSNGAV